MARISDKALDEKTKKTVCKRMKMARLAARMTLDEAAKKIGHENSTQLSLNEKGERLLPLYSLVKLCDIYGVSLDWMTGRINDPIAEPFEVTQGVITNVVAQAIQQNFEEFAQATAERAAIAISTYRQDRTAILAIIERVMSVSDEHKKVKRMNPDYDDNIRNGACFEREFYALLSLVQNALSRIQEDDRQYSLIDRAGLEPSQLTDQVSKLTSQLNAI